MLLIAGLMGLGEDFNSVCFWLVCLCVCVLLCSIFYFHLQSTVLCFDILDSYVATSCV